MDGPAKSDKPAMEFIHGGVHKWGTQYIAGWFISGKIPFYKWVITLEIMGCLPLFSTGDSDFATIHRMFNDSGQYFVPKESQIPGQMSKPGPQHRKRTFVGSHVLCHMFVF